MSDERPGTRRTMLLLRHGLPAAVCAVAIVIVIARGGDAVGLEGAAGFLGAGLSIWLLSLLTRLGFDNEAERDAEEAAREYLDVHGRWPDEDGVDARTLEVQAVERRPRVLA
ncbi:MAG: hypothetical protein ACLGHP_10095 [Vicinamibacteria bacterium]